MPQLRTKFLLAVVAAALFVAYVSSYVVLSRRGYAEADRFDWEGFYYFTPENTDAWRRKNLFCERLFWPLNRIDRWIGLGRVPAYEPMWDLSNTSNTRTGVS